jgi:hypothetical protein
VASFLAAERSLVNFSRMKGSLGMAPLKRRLGEQATDSFPPKRGERPEASLALAGHPRHRSRASASCFSQWRSQRKAAPGCNEDGFKFAEWLLGDAAPASEAAFA